MKSVTPLAWNEPIQQYAPGSADRDRLEKQIDALQGSPRELCMTIAGERRLGSGVDLDVVQPHRRSDVLGIVREASLSEALDAVTAALNAAEEWRRLPFDERASVFLKAAELLSGPWRERLVAATMLGQSKTAIQAEIDAACELIDFWRFNVNFAEQIALEQPHSSHGVWNRSDMRPLEGFVYAVTPFNFTAIAGNLATAPALMGNTVVWKPATTQMFSAVLIMELLEEAGLPAGVINLVTGQGPTVSQAVLSHRELAGIHFTGSTPVFREMWRTVGENIALYRSYPRLVGETGGKDFILAHSSADPDVLRTAIVRGAFEYQGQKCSAASRAYVSRSVWNRIRQDVIDDIEGLAMGDVTDLSNFMGAVIDERAYERLAAVIDAAHQDPEINVVAGGTYSRDSGWFIRPTLVECQNPNHQLFKTEYFGPFIAVFVFDDADFEATARGIDKVTSYALTGSVIASDRRAIAWATEELRFAAGNFYINDKPTGAVVGQQPFGGGRASGTNDKAGSAQNLLRWTSTRSIKETFVPPTSYAYPHME